MLKSLIVQLALIGVILCTFGSKSPHPIKMIMNKHMDSTPVEAFKVWHYLYQKQYKIDSVEGLKRYENFKKNYELVKGHNLSGNNYSIGLNNFADLTIQEYHEQYLKGNARMFKNIQKLNVDEKKAKELVNFWDLPEEEEDDYIELFLKEKKTPEPLRFKGVYNGGKNKKEEIEMQSINWIEKAKLSKFIENQGLCGSCWAFSSAQAIQAAYTIKTGDSVILSKQQLIDCDTESNGCDGGLMQNAMEYVMKNGIEPEKVYPYEMEGGKCHHSPDKILTKITSYDSCVDGKECATDENLYEMLTKGPVSAVVDASEEFMLYEDGIFDKKCEEANHAILLVGYHQKENDNDTPYWIVKNSWGIEWGDHGYIKIKQSKDYNSCLLNTYFVKPNI